MEEIRKIPDMLNTPGIYYAIAYLLSTITFLHTLPHKIKGIKKWLIVAALGSFLCAFMVLTKDIPQAWFLITVLFEFGIVFVIFLVIVDMEPSHCLYYTVRSYIYGEFAASMEWQLMCFGVEHWRMSFNLRTNLIFMVPIYVILLGIVLAVGLHQKEETANLEFSRGNVMGAVFIGVVVYALSNLSFITTNTPFSARYTEEILLLRTMTDFSGAVILFMYDIVLRQMHVAIENKTLQTMLDTQYANYQVSRDSVDLINRKYHDLKHQIRVLKSEINQEDSLKYLDQMEQDIKKYEAENKTQNKVLDIILTSKSLACQNHHIELTVVADGEAIAFMEPMDISALFGNALDNAIESVRQIENYTERLIHLTIVKQKAFVHITVENRYVGEIRFRNGLPVTSKSQEKGYHGFGVKSIKSTVEKYGGSMTVNADNEWFRLNILIAIP